MGQPAPEIGFIGLSKATRYALRAMAYLAKRGENRFCLVEEAAKAENLPQSYLAKVFQKLAHRGFLDSRRGVNGGYALRKEPAEITLGSIVEAIEEPIVGDRPCLLQVTACSKDRPCALHDSVMEAEEKLKDSLRRCTLKDIVESERRTDSKDGAGKPRADAL